MAKEFYDNKGKPTPIMRWEKEDMDRICLNCGERFGNHSGYLCPKNTKM